jgi:hypothetical protein
MTADYGNTIVLEDVQLLDENNVALSAWSLEDNLSGDTVFDQTGRLAPVIPSPIPEPGTWALMMAGLFAVSGVARRASRRQPRHSAP